jgi:transposase
LRPDKSLHLDEYANLEQVAEKSPNMTPSLIDALEFLIDPETRGDPESPLRWTCKSTRILAKRLVRQKHSVSHTKVAQLLHELGYSLQSNRKTEEGEDHPDRDAQFRHINTQVKRALSKGTPVVSVDTKKKELVGELCKRGRAVAAG